MSSSFSFGFQDDDIEHDDDASDQLENITRDPGHQKVLVHVKEPEIHLLENLVRYSQTFKSFDLSLAFVGIR